MSSSLLFVCGSLSEGMVHFSKIETFISSKVSGLVAGSVFRLEVGFPVYVADGSSSIRGHLLTLENADTLFMLLDEFHGYSANAPEKSLFLRVATRVQLENGETAECFIYAMNPKKLPKTATLIEDGDWVSDFNRTPPLTQALTERQKTYICKLGSSSGRDIVPINLDLYRELMGKGLIVDKGRRLALTKLGQEVFRYLG